jgi:predicted transposase YbfD/YdcC
LFPLFVDPANILKLCLAAPALFESVLAKDSSIGKSVAHAQGDLPHRAHPRAEGPLLASIDSAAMSAAELLQLSRNHWHIENSLFHVRDITFREDYCRVRLGSAPQALAAIRDAALNLIRKTGQKPHPARKAFSE